MVMIETSQTTTTKGTIEAAVKERLDRFEANTMLQRPTELTVLQLDTSGVKILEMLGKGTFCTVHRASLHSRPGDVYALKRLNPMIREKAFRKGAIDLGLEAKLLSRLYHPNIIQIHGVMKGSTIPAQRQTPFFIVIDYLVATLDSVLDEWKQEEHGGFMKQLNKTKASIKLLNRIESAAMGIARGMEYLHSKGIIFRDLKPQNIGFDLHGCVRIFDFGVAREMQQVLKQGEKLGFTGTPRYMANEVGAGETYDLSADVYSFGILLWQICTLRLPFHKMNSLDDYQVSIVVGNARPSLSPVKSADLAMLISRCWCPIPQQRPTFPQICERLEQYITKTSSDLTRGVGVGRWSKRRSSLDGNMKGKGRRLSWSSMTTRSVDTTSVASTVSDGSTRCCQPLIHGQPLSEAFCKLNLSPSIS